MAEIESRLAELERRLESNWSNEVDAEIRQAISLYEEVSLREICFLWREARARQYGEGERAGRTLAALLRKPWANDYVSEVMDGGGESVSGSGGIMQVFTEFYAGLYTAPTEIVSAPASQGPLAPQAGYWLPPAFSAAPGALAESTVYQECSGSSAADWLRPDVSEELQGCGKLWAQ
ncbi:hypothetical protein NDU88_004387 [Pleurodeles waltl]|uniref:Uncharacterized protein n=1 Tax=Pleurodeles waltl TaxID=8319 RepID=A0AAV7QEN6_PLEWA|nr:hypothetical protein NDU88_004387 [Pleurodeles waltl]